MTVLAVLAGFVLIGAALVDLMWTTIAAGSGAGPITGRLAAWQWRFALYLHHRRPSHTLLSAAGVLVVVSGLLTWVAMLFTGWALVFGAADGAVRDTETGEPAGLVARVYFTGFTVFTLGIGDYAPGEGIWRLLTVAATGTGLILVTLAITFLVPMASATTARRAIASSVRCLGGSPHEIVLRAWNGTDFAGLDQHLTDLTARINSARQQHHTYPMLHYLHSHRWEDAAPLALADLSRAVHLLRHVADTVRPPAAVLEPLDRAIDGFLDTVRLIGAGDAEVPSVPSPEPLAAVGVPLAERAAGTDDRGSGDRRRRLAQMLAADGWDST